MMSNIAYESIKKKTPLERSHIDIVAFIVLVVCWSIAVGFSGALLVAMVLALLWTHAMHVDQKWQSGRMAHQHKKYKKRVPLPLPDLVMTVRGPILDRGRILHAGDWPIGHRAEFEILVLNPSEVRPQFPVTLSVDCDSRVIEISHTEPSSAMCPEPGEYVSWTFMAHAVSHSAGAANIHICVKHADTELKATLHINSVVPRDACTIAAAGITRWKGGARAAFAWRGDQDLYDPSTFQSEEGLKITLGLSRRFRIPSTLYLSSRLSLVQKEHEDFCSHFGWNRHSDEIPQFINFLRNEVLIRQDLEFPLPTDKQFAMELGNHSYLHHSTHTAADSSNGWKGHVWVGAGQYPWLTVQNASSFEEQRDNIRKGEEIIREKLDIATSSWASPGRKFDKYTPQAVEAAGIEIGSDTNADTFSSVLKLIPPHNPEGCNSLVELTKKFPGDPDDAYKEAVLRYWLHATRRAGYAFIYMAHHHLLRYQGFGCYTITAHFFRHVLGDCDGDFYIGTVSALGKYWKTVLSPRTRCIEVNVTDAKVTIHNKGLDDVSGIPVEITMHNGKRFLQLVDVASHDQVSIKIG